MSDVVHEALDRSSSSPLETRLTQLKAWAADNDIDELFAPNYDTLLHIACRPGQGAVEPRIVLALLGEGASVDIANKQGLLVLDAALSLPETAEEPELSQALAIAQILCEHQARVSDDFVTSHESINAFLESQRTTKEETRPPEVYIVPSHLFQTASSMHREVKNTLDKRPVTGKDLATLLAATPFPEHTLGVMNHLTQSLERGPTVKSSDFDVDRTFFHHGNLEVDGHLSITAPFVITGELRVSGIITDCGPDSIVVIGGDVYCDSLDTSGEFHVTGSIHAKRVVHGYYNDNVLVSDKIYARLVIDDEHSNLASVKAETYFDLDAYQQGRGDGVQETLRELLVDEVFGEDGFDYKELFERMHEGKRVFRD